MATHWRNLAAAACETTLGHAPALGTLIPAFSTNENRMNVVGSSLLVI
jgi:hypothetical protein